MTVETHPYSNSRAARELDEALKAHTARTPGGLRALAAELGFKQATVLSHMATGRMAIPLDRATALANKLGLDVLDFCLAVLEQRAPDVYQALDEALGIGTGRTLSIAARQVVAKVATAKLVTDDHAAIILEVLHSKNPRERWLAPLESPFIRLVREHYPDGVALTELQPLLNGFAALLEA